VASNSVAHPVAATLGVVCRRAPAGQQFIDALFHQNVFYPVRNISQLGLGGASLMQLRQQLVLVVRGNSIFFHTDQSAKTQVHKPENAGLRSQLLANVLFRQTVSGKHVFPSVVGGSRWDLLANFLDLRRKLFRPGSQHGLIHDLLVKQCLVNQTVQNRQRVLLRQLALAERLTLEQKFHPRSLV